MGYCAMSLWSIINRLGIRGAQRRGICHRHLLAAGTTPGRLGRQPVVWYWQFSYCAAAHAPQRIRVGPLPTLPASHCGPTLPQPVCPRSELQIVSHIYLVHHPSHDGPGGEQKRSTDGALWTPATERQKQVALKKPLTRFRHPHTRARPHAHTAGSRPVHGNIVAALVSADTHTSARRRKHTRACTHTHTRTRRDGVQGKCGGRAAEATVRKERRQSRHPGPGPG